MATILDVIDNFFGNQQTLEKNLLSMSGKNLFKFGEEVRRFAKDYIPPRPFSDTNPIYLGGWPSANFWDSYHGNLAMTSLLYSGQLLVKDPISDWFSFEQYNIKRMLSARQGFLDIHDINNIKFSAPETRRFLLTVIPPLMRLRPLIENGIVVLTPSKSYDFKNEKTIEILAKSITETISSDIQDLTNRFKPHDMATEDNVRGLMIFMGGEREKQIKQQLYYSARYFASEYSLASQKGFLYTAPFDFESFLCDKGLGGVLPKTTGMKVVNSILHSELNIYQGLTPDLIYSLKDDDNFNSFRSALFQMYRDIPDNITRENCDLHICEAEDALVKPCLNEIQKEVSSGVLNKIGLDVTRAVFQMSTGILIGATASANQDIDKVIASSSAGALMGLFSSFIKKKEKGAKVIWKRLYNHQLKVQDEINHSQVMNQAKIVDETKEYWGIPEIPTPTSVTVSSGRIMIDSFLTSPKDNKIEYSGSKENPSGLCPCCSGLAYNVCCEEINTIVKQKVKYEDKPI